MKKILLFAFICAVFLPSQLEANTAQDKRASSTINEWDFDRSDTDLGSEVRTDASLDEKARTRLFRVANERLYEDYKWTKQTDEPEFKIWNMFEEIAGQDFIKKYVTEYAVYKDPETRVLGFVRRESEFNPSWYEIKTFDPALYPNGKVITVYSRRKHSSWGLAVNTSGADFTNKKWKQDMAIVLMHEFAHLLSLNETQLEFKVTNEKICAKKSGYVVPKEGCTKKKSYLTQFTKKFWSSDMIKEAKAAKTISAKKELYNKYKDEFVTVYAVTDPIEDLAESFTDFVLRARPTDNSTKSQKILFFYRYPELVKIRTEIRNNISTYFNS